MTGQQAAETVAKALAVSQKLQQCLQKLEEVNSIMQRRLKLQAGSQLTETPEGQRQLAVMIGHCEEEQKALAALEERHRQAEEQLRQGHHLPMLGVLEYYVQRMEGQRLLAEGKNHDVPGTGELVQLVGCLQMAVGP